MTVLTNPARPGRVYLAGRFSRLPELNTYRTELEAAGIVVTSRWLLGGHEWDGTDDDLIPPEQAARFAAEDLEDIDQADAIVCFTEAPRSGASRGGRHWEAGYAYGQGVRVVAIGPRENVFYCLPDVMWFETWDQARDWYLVPWLAPVEAR